MTFTKRVISSAKWVIAITEDTTISANFAKYGLLLLGSSSGYLHRLAENFHDFQVPEKASAKSISKCQLIRTHYENMNPPSWVSHTCITAAFVNSSFLPKKWPWKLRSKLGVYHIHNHQPTIKDHLDRQRKKIEKHPWGLGLGWLSIPPPGTQLEVMYNIYPPGN